MSNNNVNLDVNLDNKAAIDDWLNKTNGNSKSHTFNSYYEIRDIAEMAERELEKLGVKESERVGAMYEAVSGRRVAKSYRATRNANRLILIRKKHGWAILSIEKILIYPNQGGERKLIVKKENDDG